MQYNVQKAGEGWGEWNKDAKKAYIKARRNSTDYIVSRVACTYVFHN